MSFNQELANEVTSYFKDNITNPRRTAKDIDKVLGYSNSINYNTLRAWGKGERNRPTKANLLLPVLYERADGPLRELAFNLMNILEINQPVQG